MAALTCAMVDGHRKIIQSSVKRFSTLVIARRGGGVACKGVVSARRHNRRQATFRVNDPNAYPAAAGICVWHPDNIQEEYRERSKILMGSFAARAGSGVMDTRCGA
ncbi:MAG TPA: hypothetical protein VN681_02525 [Stellaceae bacterium]|nr:hypothetical protein [Stellaceae bacterium]